MKRSGPLARRAPLRSVTPLARYASLRQVSARRRAENWQRAKTARSIGERLCDVREARAMIGLPPLPACTTWADDWNEILRRSQLGSITDLANANFPCRRCHDYLSITPRSQLGWAFRLGLIAESRTGRWTDGDAA